MKPRYCIYTVLLVGLFLYGFWDMTRVKPEQKLLIARLRNLKELESLTLEPAQLSKKAFFDVITNKADLESAHESLCHADTKPVGGHNGPVFECIAILKAKDRQELKLAVSVHKNQEDDLYISPSFLIETRPGVFAGTEPVMVRVPGLGKWIMKKEPGGLL